MKEKTWELKEIIEVIKQNTYEKKNKKNTIPEALISTKGQQANKEEPIQKMERFGTKPKNKNFNQMVKRMTEGERNEPDESSCDMDENKRHMKEIKKIEETSKHNTATVEINCVRKKFKFYTGSPLTIMPMDKKQ